MKKFIVFQSNLDELQRFCKQCGSPVTERSTFCTVYLVGCRISCHAGHSYIWHSQPIVRKNPAGNLLIAASILCTRNTYSKISEFAKTMNLQFLGKTRFNKIQKENVLPVIQETWETDRKKVVKNLKKRKGGLLLAGDSRSDSPGHTAKYGSYTLMHADGDGKLGTKKIVSTKLVQVSEVKNSNHMEPEGLKRCLEEVKNDKLKVSILATDRHKMVNSIMNKEYKKIQHQFDTWHASKGVVKQLTAKSKSTECSNLEPWIQSVSNHLWWCCATCGGNAQLLREKWLSVLNHITNKHTWTGNSKFHKCAHRRLTAAEKKATKWLKPESAAFKALQAIVTKKSLLTAMAKLTKFCHTGELEVYHNMLLKYCPKRQHFSYDGELLGCRNLNLPISD